MTCTSLTPISKQAARPAIRPEYSATLLVSSGMKPFTSRTTRRACSVSLESRSKITAPKPASPGLRFDAPSKNINARSHGVGGSTCCPSAASTRSQDVSESRRCPSDAMTCTPLELRNTLASASVANPRYKLPWNPLTCRSHSDHVWNSPVSRPLATANTLFFEAPIVLSSVLLCDAAHRNLATGSLSLSPANLRSPNWPIWPSMQTARSEQYTFSAVGEKRKKLVTPGSCWTCFRRANHDPAS